MAKCRKCIICKNKRQTTNKEKPYVCEPCLRTKGRRLILWFRWLI